MPLGKFKIISCIVCEEVRDETSGAKIVVGMHGGYFMHDEGDARIPICLAVEGQTKKTGEIDGHYRLRWVKGKGDTSDFSREFSTKPESLKSVYVSVFYGTIGVEEVGELSFEVKQNDGRWEHIRTIWIEKKEETPTSSTE